MLWNSFQKLNTLKTLSSWIKFGYLLFHSLIHGFYLSQLKFHWLPVPELSTPDSWSSSMDHEMFSYSTISNDLISWEVHLKVNDTEQFYLKSLINNKLKLLIQTALNEWISNVWRHTWGAGRTHLSVSLWSLQGGDEPPRLLHQELIWCFSAADVGGGLLWSGPEPVPDQHQGLVEETHRHPEQEQRTGAGPAAEQHPGVPQEESTGWSQEAPHHFTSSSSSAPPQHQWLGTAGLYLSRVTVWVVINSSYKHKLTPFEKSTYFQWSLVTNLYSPNMSVSRLLNVTFC